MAMSSTSEGISSVQLLIPKNAVLIKHPYTITKSLWETPGDHVVKSEKKTGI